MKTVASLLLLALTPGLAAAQPPPAFPPAVPAVAPPTGTPAPGSKADAGLGEAKDLNAAVIQSNDAAASRETNALTTYQQQEAARQAAYEAELARHRAEVEAVEARNRAIEAQERDAAARFQADNAAYQAQLEAARQRQAEYDRAQAEYAACIGGDRTRCPPGTGPGGIPAAPVMATAPAPPPMAPPSMPAPQPYMPQPAPVMAAAPPPVARPAGPISCSTDRPTECVSQLGGSTVMVMRRIDPNDPLKRFGAGFAVVVLNQSQQAFVFAPTDVSLTNAGGRKLTILSETALNDRAQRGSGGGLGGLLSVGAALAGASGSGGNNSSLTNSLVNGLAQNSQQSAQRRAAEGQAAAATYSSSMLRPMVVPPGATSSGQIVVDDIDDTTPVTLTIKAGGDTHTVRFAR